ncbi:MAG: FMN-binding protein [Candidatus Auribacterota bacterium]|jgi:Na+-translocating ferredoxin:NAD+ oxidoreductase RnfG subunit|nr:FMN-binding protein [Candidatus Auribacterota bacterium]
MKRSRLLLSKLPQLIIMAAIAAFITIRAQTPPAVSQDDHEYKEISIITLSQVQKLYPSAVSFIYNEQADKLSEVFDMEGTLIGYFIATTPYADDVRGYGGAVPLLIGIDAGGKIAGVSFLPNAESGGFVKIITAEGVLDSWNGLAVDEALEKEVDAVSGATMTSTAVIESFKKRLFFFVSKQQ